MTGKPVKEILSMGTVNYTKRQLRHTATQAVTWREMARGRAARSRVQSWSLCTPNPTTPQVRMSLVGSEKSVFSVQVDVGWAYSQKAEIYYKISNRELSKV